MSRTTVNIFIVEVNPSLPAENSVLSSTHITLRLTVQISLMLYSCHFKSWCIDTHQLFATMVPHFDVEFVCSLAKKKKNRQEYTQKHFDFPGATKTSFDNYRWYSIGRTNYVGQALQPVFALIEASFFLLVIYHTGLM